MRFPRHHEVPAACHNILPDYANRHPRSFSDADLRTLQAIIGLAVATPGVTRADLLTSIASGARPLVIPGTLTPFQPLSTPANPSTEVMLSADHGAVAVLARSLAHLVEEQATKLTDLTNRVTDQAATIAHMEADLHQSQAMLAEQGAMLARLLAHQIAHDTEQAAVEPPEPLPISRPATTKPSRPFWRRLLRRR